MWLQAGARPLAFKGTYIKRFPRVARRSFVQALSSSTATDKMSSPARFTLDPSLFNQSLYISVLRLWFPTYPEPSSSSTEADMLHWFAPPASMDSDCRALAGRALDSIGPDHLRLPPFTSFSADHDLYNSFAEPFIGQINSASAEGDGSAVVATAGTAQPSSHIALALAILLDQFPRNIFRGPSQSIVYTHYDRLSRAVSAHTRSLGLDRVFADTPAWRFWFYMPLEHSEAVSDHEAIRVALREMLLQAKERGDDAGVKFLEQTMGFEERHFGPLSEFGRYPWRNRWLGRESTEAESKWLEQGGETFGTE